MAGPVVRRPVRQVGVLGAKRTRRGSWRVGPVVWGLGRLTNARGRMWVTWHGGWGCWALYERERAGVGDVARQVGVLAAKRTRKGESDGVAHRSASWTLNERERADVGDVARRVGVLGAVQTREGRCG